MTGIFKKSVLAAALAATTLATATPAMADPYGNYRHRGNGDTAGAAILGGIIGLTIGVIAASAGKKHDRCDYNRDHDGYRDGYRHDNRGRYCDRDGRYRDYPQQGGYYGNDPRQGGYYDRQGDDYAQRGYREGDDDRGYDERGDRQGY
ncbi:hypothetical protein ACFFF7_02930 [Novosphingobium aquiterrae]|uniref:17 kDa surface antigen n=1 Tax=Novosphingobium aquiterrae TaxID=624388 RepID=A0ABV6PEW7_9SPHN